MPATAFLGERPTEQLAWLACAPNATETMEARSVPDGSHLGTLPVGTPQDLAEAARRAGDAQRAWAAMPAYFRLAAFRRFAGLLDAYRPAIAEVVWAETGGTLQAADDLVGRLGPECLSLARGTVASLRPVKHRTGLRVRAVEVRRPHGVVGLVPAAPAPFDPVTATAALVTGNGLVLVPPPGCGFSSLLLTRLFAASRLPQGLVQVVPGRAELALAAVTAVDHLVLAAPLADLSSTGGGEVAVTVGPPVDPLAFTTTALLTRR